WSTNRYRGGTGWLPTGFAVVATAAALAAILVAPAAAVTTTTAATITSAPSVAAVAATGSAVGARASFVHGQIPTAKLFPVKLFNCRCSFFGSRHLDKTKAA